MEPSASCLLFQNLPQAQNSSSHSRQFLPFPSQPAYHNSRPPPSLTLLEGALSFLRVPLWPFLPIRFAINVDNVEI